MCNCPAVLGMQYHLCAHHRTQFADLHLYWRFNVRCDGQTLFPNPDFDPNRHGPYVDAIVECQACHAQRQRVRLIEFCLVRYLVETERCLGREVIWSPDLRSRDTFWWALLMRDQLKASS